VHVLVFVIVLVLVLSSSMSSSIGGDELINDEIFMCVHSSIC
jgi:hypothetical protein